MKTLIITIVFLVAGYFTGILRPTGPLSRTPSILTSAQQRRLLQTWLVTFIPLGIFWVFAYNGIWQRLQTELDGTIIARQDFPRTPQTHGPTTAYKVQRNDGSLIQYTATRTDDSLPQTMPVGAHIAKQKWELSYSLDGKRINDLSLTFCVVLLVIGVLCLIRVAMLFRGWKQDFSRASSN